MRLEGLLKKSSNHTPIILQLESRVDWGPKVFRCLDIWFIDPRFKALVQKEWSDMGRIPLD